MSGVRMRSIVPRAVPRVLPLLLTIVLIGARPARAQDPPPRIPWFVVDLHGSVPGFPSDDQELADSRGMQLAELPGRGLGVQLGAHLYPLRWRAVTFGIGGEFAVSRARQTPPTGSTLRPSDERYRSLAPQLSFNFGTGNGWSYLSGGIGQSTWAITPEGQEDYPPDSERLKTINYGGGARWFIKTHLAFSFDVRFYAINPGLAFVTADGTVRPGSPRTTLLVIGAGVSIK
jgi:hypothetical protein